LLFAGVSHFLFLVRRLDEIGHGGNECGVERLEMELPGEECDAIAACLGVQGVGRGPC
jgi:hypothetical protein